MTRKYYVLQGLQTKEGFGDYEALGIFDNLEEARKCFEYWKERDIEGWVNYRKGSYVETNIEYIDFDDEGEMIDSRGDEIIDSYQVFLKGGH